MVQFVNGCWWGVLLGLLAVLWGCSETSKEPIWPSASSGVPQFSYAAHTGGWEYRGDRPALVLFYNGYDGNALKQQRALWAADTMQGSGYIRYVVGIDAPVLEGKRVGGLPLWLFLPLGSFPVSRVGYLTVQEIDSMARTTFFVISKGSE